MFPISSDGVFEDPSIFLELEDLFADCPIQEGNEKGVQKRPRKVTSTISQVHENDDGGGSDSKKTAHRFIEKQRRQEMTALYASLRSLLPLQYVKGKRAISDHMHQAVNYVNDMKKKIEELQKRRDEFRHLCNVATTCADADDPKPKTNVNVNGDDCVKINLFRDGMEILISHSLNNKIFPLSKVLADLLDRQLNVVYCVSTTAASCYHQKIHIQLNDETSIDLPELQERLQNLIRFS